MIKLRKKQLSDGSYSLYSDIYFEGKRHCRSLNLRLTKDKENNKEVLKLANNIRATKELEYQSYQHGSIPAFKTNPCSIYHDYITESLSTERLYNIFRCHIPRMNSC